MNSCFSIVICLFAMTSIGGAGEFNRTVNIGDTLPSWSGLVGVDGETHALEDWQGSKAIVVAFICNSCPYATDAEQRIIDLQKKYSEQGVSVIAINSNKITEDQLPAMKQRAESQSFTFPYLYDESQEVAKTYGAKYTPEFFVLGPTRELLYMGALDDSPDGSNVTRRYVEDALAAILAGDRLEVAETVPVGCRIRIERVRRKRAERD